ncbi:hypothetical protein [Brachybacterium alimentarium]|uniref:hypothetical protein n=1 Tax=Brachybacterium alimentarium TaxID=47845 RepID=UPI0011C04C88|nr:hypothetical protein [Brachybacterium alimentarium]
MEAARKKAATPGSEEFVAALRRGVQLEEAAVLASRSMLKGKRFGACQAFADGLKRHENTRVAGRICAGLVANHRGFYGLSLHEFSAVSDDELLTFAGIEWIQSLFAEDRVQAVKNARRWLAEKRGLSARLWFEVYRQLFVCDELRLADEAFALLELAYDDPVEQRDWPAGRDEIAWGRRWLGVERNTSAPRSEKATVSFGLLDYVQPGRTRASQNIGDQIQTLSSLGHVVRHEDLRFHGEEEVVNFVESMQGRVRPELRLQGIDADVQLVTVDRDSSTYQKFAPNTWLLEFGWHMHPLFGLDSYDFPLHPNLNPIFVAFHCSKRALLTPVAIEYLRDHGPIGCRDWTTVDLLLSLDVPAFFSGCLTTTVNTVFPDLETSPSKATAYVDVVRSSVPPAHDNIKQSYGDIKRRSFAANMWDAVNVLEGYRSKFTDVVTTRLHCYLPTTSLGLNAFFEPKNNADVRFAGLFRLDDTEFDAMRERMRDRLEPVLSAIFSGGSREDVYDLWRETVASEVKVARVRHSEVSVLPAADGMVEDLVAPITRSEVTGSEDYVDVVVTPQSKEMAHIAAMLQTAADASSRRLRAWVVCPAEQQVDLHISDVDVRWIDTSAIDFKKSGVPDRRSLDRVLLPELLPVDRAILLPVDGAVLGDLTRLWGIDLGAARIGVRRTSRADTSGFGVLYSAARRLDPSPEIAFEFYKRIHRKHVFDFEAFDNEVMVLDLQGLRSDGFSAEVLPAMERYRLDDRAALHYFAGPLRADIGAEWAYVPTRERVDEPKIWHWADSAKPWSADYIPGIGAEVWRAARRNH